MMDTDQTFDIEAAKAAIEAAKQERARRASHRIDEVLQEERCTLQTIPTFTPDGRVTAQIAIVAQE